MRAGQQTTKENETMRIEEITATARALAARVCKVQRLMHGDGSTVRGVDIEAIARTFATDEDARILFNMLVMNLAAHAEVRKEGK